MAGCRDIFLTRLIFYFDFSDNAAAIKSARKIDNGVLI
jgi:hypothetical protein